MDSYKFLKAQHDEILEQQNKKLAKRIGDECFGEASPAQIERIYRILAGEEPSDGHKADGK